MPRCARLVFGIREFASHAELADAPQWDVLLYREVANHGIGAPPGQFQVGRLRAGLIREALHLNHVIVHAAGICHRLIEMVLRFLRQDALADLEIDLDGVRQSVVIQVLNGCLQVLADLVGVGVGLLRQHIRGVRLAVSLLRCAVRPVGSLRRFPRPAPGVLRLLVHAGYRTIKIADRGFVACCCTGAMASRTCFFVAHPQVPRDNVATAAITACALKVTINLSFWVSC